MGGVGWCLGFGFVFSQVFSWQVPSTQKTSQKFGSLVSENYSEVQKLHCCPPGTQDRIDPVNKHCGFLLSLSHASTEAQSLL